MRPFLTISLLLTSIAGCTCGGPGEPRSRPTTSATDGEESNAAIAYEGRDELVPPAEAFTPVTGPDAMAALTRATRAGSWAGLRRGREERRSAGNFACRLETLYGRAPIALENRVAWILRNEETGLLVTAVASAGEPTFGVVIQGVLGGETSESAAAEAASMLALLVDGTTPRDCAYVIDGVEVGVRDGEYF